LQQKRPRSTACIADAAPQDLADFYAAVIYGLSMSARAGLPRDALQHIASRAMLAFPA
jgi:hypothetical protein